MPPLPHHPFVVAAFALVGLLALIATFCFFKTAFDEWIRNRGLAALAAARGLTYSAGERLPTELERSQFFSRCIEGNSSAREMQHVLRGRLEGAEVLLFDYSYTESLTATRGRVPAEFTIVCLRRSSYSPWDLYPRACPHFLDLASLPGFLRASLADWKHSHPVA